MWFRKAVLAVAALACLGSAALAGDVSVRGYYRKDGTYVRPHMRSAPDGNFHNNWSMYGNVNPYTGRVGTKISPPTNYGQDVSVRGHYRSDGTYVRPHMRSNPDGRFENNWSAKGNTNPYTGQPGTRVTPAPARPKAVASPNPNVYRAAPKPPSREPTEFLWKKQPPKLDVQPWWAKAG